MRSILLAGTAIALLASPAYAFNFGSIHNHGSFNTVLGSQLTAPPPDDLFSTNILDGDVYGNFNHMTIKQKSGKWSTNTALGYQDGNGNSQVTDQETADGTGFFTPRICIPRPSCFIVYVPALPVPTHLNSNTAWTVQIGDDNYALTYQRGGTGPGNYSGTLQVGWANGSAVFQIGGNSQDTIQIGFLNGSVTGQFGEGNRSTTLQLGMLNGQITIQGGDDNKSTTKQIGLLNGSATGQFGHDNEAETTQVGVLNGAATLQIGGHNDADTTQIGAFNGAATVQVGHGNDADTTQIGAFNVATTTQLGDGNSSDVEQSGFGNTSEVSQSSQHNWASVGQEGTGNTVVLTQGTY